MSGARDPRELRLTLVRHGRSAHDHAGWVDAEGFRAWRAAYERAGVRPGETAPRALAARAAAELVVTSDAPRALDSARLLAGSADCVVSPLLRELDLQGPELGRLRMPLRAWAFAVGWRMLTESLRRRYPTAAETERLREAAEFLEHLAGERGSVLAVTHASFRGRLATTLEERCWRPDREQRSFRHWSAWSWTKRA